MSKFYKVVKNIILVFLVSFFMIPTINASWPPLWHASSSTYVKRCHGDSCWANEYIGSVAVWGIDRKIKSGKIIITNPLKSHTMYRVKFLF